MKKTISKVSGTTPAGSTTDPGGVPPGLSREEARELSHRLRTPLSAMAGWLHLMQSGSLDEPGLKRAIDKLQSNVDDQVRAIEEYLGDTREERH